MFVMRRERQYLSSPKIHLITAQTTAASRTWWMVNTPEKNYDTMKVDFLVLHPSLGYIHVQVSDLIHKKP